MSTSRWPGRLALLALAFLVGCGSAATPGTAPAGDGAVAGNPDVAPVDGFTSGGDDSATDRMSDDGQPGVVIGNSDGGAPNGSCSGMVCNTPPPTLCQGDVLKTYYDPNGTCEAGLCSYRYTTQQCPHGCSAGRCLDGSGGGSGGSGGPGASGGTGGGNLCSEVRCDSPPANVCDGAMLKTYPDPYGNCSNGACTYRFTTQTCPRGCKNGSCVTCTPGPAAFTADVTDINSLATVGPLPALAGGAAFEIRSYMQVKDSYAGIKVPIYAPTDLTIQASSHYTDPLHDPSDTDYHGEWGLVFEATCTTQVSFAHVREVVPAIAEVTVPSTTSGSAGELVSHAVNFKAGDVIGYYTRGVGYFAWDFIVTDSSVTNQFVNMPRYLDAQSKFLHGICPFDPYPPSMRQKYLDILGTNLNPPVMGRKCGTLAHDVDGTAAGVWFHTPYTSGGATEARRASGNPMSIFKAETDVVFLADLDGDTSTVGFTTFRIETFNPTYRNPETITSSYCYERHPNPGSPATGWVYVNVLPQSQLAVAYSLEGACPATFPTTGLRTYYR